MKNEMTPTPAAVSDDYKLQESSKYTIKGMTFEVERAFNNNSKETVGTILLRLLKMESQT